MEKVKPLLVFGLFVLFLTPNLVQIIRGKEHFPFSNNPMFGHNASLGDTLATVSFELENLQGELSPISYSDLNLWEVRFKRYYFSNVYGSSENNSPQENMSPTREDFVRNHEEFLTKLANLVKSKNIEAKGIYVYFVKVSSSDVVIDKTPLGYFDIKDAKFNLL